MALSFSPCQQRWMEPPINFTRPIYVSASRSASVLTALRGKAAPVHSSQAAQQDSLGMTCGNLSLSMGTRYLRKKCQATSWHCGWLSAGAWVGILHDLPSWIWPCVPCLCSHTAALLLWRPWRFLRELTTCQRASGMSQGNWVFCPRGLTGLSQDAGSTVGSTRVKCPNL